MILFSSISADKYFYDFDNNYNHDAAGEYCENNGGWLAYPESQEEWDYMHK